MDKTVDWGKEGDRAEEVANKMAKIEEAIDGVARNFVTNVREKVIMRTPVGDPKIDPHSGQLKESWSEVQDSGGGFSFSTNVPYSIILEKGLYTRVGPGTVAVGEGIFSAKAPGGIVTPIVTDQNLISQLINDVKEAILRVAGG